jgi:hypothetical protein
MLNTFENADRQHRRRVERQRHMRDMELLSNSLEWNAEDSRIVAIADGLVGNPLERATQLDSTHTPKLRRRYKLFALAGLVAVAIILPLSFVLGKDVGENESLIEVGESDSDSTTQHTVTEVRHTKILSLILDWDATPRTVLEDSRSAPARAMEWLVNEDTATDQVETIRTRFVLATLYFSTQNVSTGKSWRVDTHWLSTYPVCLWHGVQCLDEYSTIGLVKSLNLSSNFLTGTLPHELGLLELDCSTLDVSNNAITGSIPETLFLMKNLGKS